MITAGYRKVDRSLGGVGLCTGGSYAHSAVLPNGLVARLRPRLRASALARF